MSDAIHEMALTLATAAFVLGAAAAAPCAAQPAAWKPAKSVEIVVGVSPGGGVDRTARLLQKIVQERRLIEVPALVVNKPGGGGAIAHAYLGQRPGDAHLVEISATSLLTNHLIGKSAVSHRDFTPIAMLYDEYIGFLVREDSPLRTGKDLLETLKAAPDSLAIGIATAAGNTNHIAAALAARSAGGDVRKLKIVVFGSGGESMTALLGGHVGLVVTPSANGIPHLQAGRMRMLAVAAPRRLDGALAPVPTWKEAGAEVVVANWRPIIGPKGLSGAQIAFWEDVLLNVTRSDEWKSEMARSGGVSHYMNGRDLGAYLDQQYGMFKGILTDLGLAR